MPKPTEGQVDWADDMNAYLSGLEAAIAAVEAARAVPSRLQPVTQQMVTPPTVTQGAAGGASSLAGGTTLAHSNAALTYFGTRHGIGPAFPDDQYTSPTYIAATDGSKALYTGGPWGVEFEYNGQQLELRVKGAGVAARYRCTVDGEGYESRAGNAGPPSDGNAYYILYNFGSAKSRRIRFDFDTTLRLRSIVSESGSTITATTKAFGPSVVVIGDSFTDGTGAGATFSAYGDRLGQYLNWRDLTMSGWGGTGYVATNGGTRTTFGTRLQKDVIDAAPDIVILAGGINDQTAYVEATFEAAVDAVLDELATDLPSADVIVVGPWWKSGSPVANIVRVRDSIRQEAIAHNSRLFVDNIGGTIPYTGIEADYEDTGWMTGTGYNGNPQNDGNSDFYTGSDTTHPTQAGHDYLALKLAEAIASGAPDLIG